MSMWYQQTKRLHPFRLVDPHSYISICIDTEAEKFTGWHVSDCRFSITQVFVLEKSGIVTSSILWPFSPEKAIQTTWACNFKGMTRSKTNNNRYSRQLWQISWHILVFVSSFTTKFDLFFNKTSVSLPWRTLLPYFGWLPTKYTCGHFSKIKGSLS